MMSVLLAAACRIVIVNGAAVTVCDLPAPPGPCRYVKVCDNGDCRIVEVCNGRT